MQIEQNDQKITQTIMKIRIEKSVGAKMKKIQSHLDFKLNQRINLIQSYAKAVEHQDSKKLNSISLMSLISRQYKDQNAFEITSSSNL